MKWMILVFTICIAFSGWASEPATVISMDEVAKLADQDALDLTSQIEISRQPASEKNFRDFVYSPNGRSDIKVPYTADAVWFRLQLQNTTESVQEKVLYFSSALTGSLDLYDSHSEFPLQHSGSSTPISERPTQTRLAGFKLVLQPGQTETFYIKRLSHHNFSSRVYLGSERHFVLEESDSKAILFFYVGGILCLIVYNLFIGIYARDLNYLLYALFASSLAAATLDTQGFFDAYIFRSLPFTLSHYLMVFSSVSVWSCLLFVYRFLNISQTLPRARFGFYVLGISALITFVQGLFPFNNAQVIFGHLIDLTIFSLLLYLIGSGIIVYRRGYQLAQFFLLSWVSLFVGVLGWFGMTYGVFHHSALTSHALMFGNMGEMLILSLGLAYKIAILDAEKRKALYQAKEKERYHRLVKVLSHDVANAISIFSGYLLRLRRAIKDHPEIVTVSKLERALDNIKGILDLVRGEEALNSFRLAVHLRPIPLKETVSEVISFYEDRIEQKGLQITMKIPEDCVVMADKTALGNQVLSNLLSNAIKFSHPQTEILISVQKDQKCTVLQIKDHGVGILPEDIQRVFFSEEITSKPGTLQERGSGFGSSLVKDYMDIFNGRIEVQSVHESVSKDCGTCVSLYFPRVEI